MGILKLKIRQFLINLIMPRFNYKTGYLMKNLILILITLLLLAGCATVPTGFSEIDKEDLSEIIDEIFSDTLFTHAHWGVLVESLNSGELIYERNADRMFMPASNEKIPTSAAALTYLGPDYKFETVIGTTGNIVDSTLNGDLIIIGDGDPTISDRVFEKTTTIFENWADSLKRLGIDTVKGNIIGDDNKFDDEHIGYGWTHGGLDYWYSAEFGVDDGVGSGCWILVKIQFEIGERGQSIGGGIDDLMERHC